MTVKIRKHKGQKKKNHIVVLRARKIKIKTAFTGPEIVEKIITDG